MPVHFLHHRETGIVDHRAGMDSGLSACAFVGIADDSTDWTLPVCRIQQHQQLFVADLPVQQDQSEHSTNQKAVAFKALPSY
jgi:hypothetical protein